MDHNLRGGNRVEGRELTLEKAATEADAPFVITGIIGTGIGTGRSGTSGDETMRKYRKTAKKAHI